MVASAQRGVTRLAAALAALAISGAPQLLEAPPAGSSHRCHCPVRDGHHDCDCPLCHAEAARATVATQEPSRAPPCHRAVAAGSERSKPVKRAPSSGPVLVSSCGGGDRHLVPPPSSESFTLPSAAVIGHVVTVELLDTTSSAPRATPHLPDPPPPKQA